MSVVEHRGSKIYYRVSGNGPLLVLLHGFFGSHADWKWMGYVDLLKTKFTVATLDSLAHGQSGFPVDADRYQMVHRAGDIAAVMDDLGHKHAHLVGYSMGGWWAIAFARYFPQRLLSLSVGGWDCLQGMGPGLLAGAGKSRLGFDEYLERAQAFLPPGALDSIEGDAKTALGHCYEQLYNLEGGAQAIKRLEVPVTFYCGIEDACHDPMQRFTSDEGLSFLSVPGDHGGAMRNSAPVLADWLKACR